MTVRAIVSFGALCVMLAACGSGGAQAPPAATSAAPGESVRPTPASTSGATGASATSGARPAPMSGLGPRESQSLPSCPSGPLFGVIPMSPSDFRSFRPIGFPQPPIHIFGAKHSNFTINLPGQAAVSGKAIRFPSDAWVTEIIATKSALGTGHQLTFFPCREFKSYLFHIGELAPALATELAKASVHCQDFDFGAAGGRTTKCTARVLLPVKAGDPVGGSDAFGGVDWGGVDYRVALPFVNLSRYDGDYPHYVSPVDYTTPEVRAIFDGKLGSLDGTVLRTAEPRTGTLMQDVAGTAQGNWFIGTQTFRNVQDFSPFLALLHDFVDPAVPIFSMGSSVKGLRLGLYTFTPQPSGLVNRDFADVRPDGQTYCYERFGSGQTRSGLNLSTADGVILLAMPSATRLSVEFQQGGTCATARTLTTGAFTFDR